MSLQHLYKETIQWILDPIINATVIFQVILHTEFCKDTIPLKGLHLDIIN